MKDETAEPAADPSTGRRPLRLSRIVAWTAGGGVVGVGLGLVFAVLLSRDRTPQVSAEELSAAQARWQRSGPASYDIDVETTGPRNDRIHVEIRQGRVTLCTINGRPPTQRRVWDSWTVPQQFGYIQEDLDRAGPAAESRAILRARFDPQNGLPLEYRHVSAGGEVDNGWRVTRFEPVALAP